MSEPNLAPELIRALGAALERHWAVRGGGDAAP